MTKPNENDVAWGEDDRVLWVQVDEVIPPKAKVELVYVFFEDTHQNLREALQEHGDRMGLVKAIVPEFDPSIHIAIFGQEINKLSGIPNRYLKLYKVAESPVVVGGDRPN